MDTSAVSEKLRELADQLQATSKDKKRDQEAPIVIPPYRPDTKTITDGEKDLQHEPDPDGHAERVRAREEARRRAEDERQMRLRAIASEFDFARQLLGNVRFVRIVQSVGGTIASDGRVLMSQNESDEAAVIIYRALQELADALSEQRRRERLERERREWFERINKDLSELDRIEEFLRTA